MPRISEMRVSKFLKKDDVGRGVLVTIADCRQYNVAKEGADPIKVTMKLNKDLGDRKTKLAWTWETGTAKVLETRGLDSAPGVVILEVGEKEGEVKTLGKVTGDDPKLINQGIDDILKGATK